MKSIVIAAALMLSGLSAQAKNVANNELPFKFAVVKVEPEKRAGVIFTIVTVKISNGEHYLPSANFHCEAKSSSGRTWDVAGVVRNLDPREVRTARISDEGSSTDEANIAASVSCEVQSFDGGLR